MQSPLINMEMQGWRMDSVVSFGMACAFLLPMFIPFAWFQKFVPYLDQIITVVLSLIMIPAPIHTIITGFRDLMLIIGIYGHKNLYYDIVRTGRKLWVSVYITFDKDIVSLSKFKFLQDECILALAKKYPDFYFELLPDIEFTGLERV